MFRKCAINLFFNVNYPEGPDRQIRFETDGCTAFRHLTRKFATMKLTPRLLLFVTAMLALYSCVDPIPFDSGEGQEYLVVEANITNEPGSHIVKLSTTNSFNSFVNIAPDIIRDADIAITDDLGNEVSLEETAQPGVYVTPPSFRGETGRTYILHIRTRNGKEYRSTPETLNPVPDIDSLYFETVEADFNALGDSTISGEGGIKIYGDIQDPPGINNYYRWSWQGTYKVVVGCLNCINTCWVSESNSDNIYLSNDEFRDGQVIKKQEAQLIPLGFRGPYGYTSLISLYSLSEQAYQFYDALNEQRSSRGSLTDPPPVILQGNIEPVSDRDEKVYGLFTASAVTQKRITIAPDQIDYNYSTSYPDTTSCLVFPNSTDVCPDYWTLSCF